MIQPKSKLGMALQKRMQEKGVTIAQLANKVGVVYETMRKTVGGTQPPGKRLLRDIATFLDMDFNVLDQIRVKEHLEAKYGDTAARLNNTNPDLTEIDRFWDFLTREQQDHIKWLVHRLAEENASPKPTIPAPVERRLGLVANSKTTSGKQVSPEAPFDDIPPATRKTDKRSPPSRSSRKPTHNNSE